MSNARDTAKRIRVNETRRKRNAANKSLLNTVRRQYLDALGNADKSRAEEAFKKFCSTLDKSAQKGIISKNSASRRKSRAHAKLVAMA